MPATVAPEHFQAHEGFVTGLTPELSGPLKAALGLSTSRFYGSAADWFAGSTSSPIVHARLMLLEVGQFFGERLGGCSPGQGRQCVFQLPDDFAGRFILELFD